MKLELYVKQNMLTVKWRKKEIKKIRRWKSTIFNLVKFANPALKPRDESNYFSVILKNSWHIKTISQNYHQSGISRLISFFSYAIKYFWCYIYFFMLNYLCCCIQRFQRLPSFSIDRIKFTPQYLSQQFHKMDSSIQSNEQTQMTTKNSDWLEVEKLM